MPFFTRYLSTLFGHLLILFRLTNVVGMTLDFEVHVRELLEQLNNLVQSLVATSSELSRTALELDTLLELVEILVLVRAAILVNSYANESVRALVEVVRYAILVGVNRATSRVFGHLSRKSTIPSLSSSGLQPSALTGRPFGVCGHLSR